MTKQECTLFTNSVTPELKDIQKYAAGEIDSFWSEYKRLNRPHRYKVDLSKALYDLKQSLLATYSENKE